MLAEEAATGSQAIDVVLGVFLCLAGLGTLAGTIWWKRVS